MRKQPCKKNNTKIWGEKRMGSLYFAPELWIDISKYEPCDEHADEHGNVYAWHKEKGATIVHWEFAINNEYITHWMPIPINPLFSVVNKSTAYYEREQ